MGMEELYSAEVRRQQEFAIAKEEAAYQQLQAAGIHVVFVICTISTSRAFVNVCMVICSRYSKNCP